MKTVLSLIFIAVFAIGCQTKTVHFSTDTIGRLSFKRTVSINGKEQTFKWNIPAEEIGPILSHLKPRGPSGDFIFVCGSEDGILSLAGKKTRVHWCREKSATPVVYFTILEKEYKLEEPYSVDFYNAIGKYAPPGSL
ncbi:MAG: hypothetical protein WC708_19915 [Lentisphaeria bacterium]